MSRRCEAPEKLNSPSPELMAFDVFHSGCGIPSFLRLKPPQLETLTELLFLISTKHAIYQAHEKLNLPLIVVKLYMIHNSYLFIELSIHINKVHQPSPLQQTFCPVTTRAAMVLRYSLLLSRLPVFELLAADRPVG